MDHDVHLKSSSVFVFSGRFLLLCALLFAGLESAPKGLFDFMNRANATAVAGILEAAGYRPVLHQTVLSIKGFSARIVGECSAVFVIALFSAFVLAYPSSVSKKALGLFIGIPMLMALNLFRLVLVIITGSYDPNLFTHVHIYFGQILMVFFVVMCSVIWLREIHSGSEGGLTPGTFLRFTVCSIGLFILWLVIKKPYAWLAFYLAKWALFLFGVDPMAVSHRAVYADAFITFNMVCFLALVLTVKQPGRSVRPWPVLLGIVVLFVSYCLFKGILAIMNMHGIDRFYVTAVNILLILQEWVLPFGLWLFLFRPVIPSLSSRMEASAAEG